MKYKIGVFGSAVDENQEIIKKAKKLGRILGKKKIKVITGACLGVPNKIAQEAFRLGSQVFGYSPVANFTQQKKFTPKINLSIYKKIYYIPKSFELASNLEISKKYRNVISTANCDAGIIISGRWGTMNEFTNLYDMGKIIGVLTGTGGIADELSKLNKKIKKKSKAKIFLSNSPKKLLEMTIKELKLRNI